MKLAQIITLFGFCMLTGYCEDLYDVLGVGKGASQQEIRKAYKKLAREWHPDKNTDPNAADKFTKINEAYETLNNPEKRSTYDNYGYTSASNNEGRNHFRHQGFSPFDNFFRGGGGSFRFNFGGGDSTIDKHSITLRNFETKIIPESHNRPCFIYAYSDFCFDCMRMESYIEKFISELLSVGLCVGTVHARHNQGVMSHLRISHVPAILGIVNGRPVSFKGGVSMATMRDFVRGWFPKNTLQTVTDKNYENFLMGWSDNRMRAIFFSQKDVASARFLAPAFFYRDHIVTAYVNTHSSDIASLRKKYGVNHNRETLLMFNEDMDTPVATISMQQLSRKTIDEVMESNKFLQLPRLSNQKFLDTLCPAEPKLKRRRFCVVLVTKKSNEHDIHRLSFRNFAQTQMKKFSEDKVKFVYIYEDTQHKFISALTKGNVTRKNTIIEVAIMWRMDTKKLNYEFLELGWNIDSDGMGESRKQLESRLQSLLTSDHLLPYKAVFTDLYNEHALSLLTRIFYRLYDWGDRIYFFVVSHDVVTIMMVLFAVITVIVMGYSMHHVATLERVRVEKQMASKKRTVRPPSSTPDNQTIHLYELRYETYNNLVKEADTGLTIVVFVDESSKEQMLTRFAQIMQPYSRYSALTFAYLKLEYYISWYQHLLELSLNFKVKLNNINIRSCVGTVLAINGYRKYYYIYHPRKARRWMKEHNNISRAIGFVDDDSDSEKEQEEENVTQKYLDGLALWMDRIFDGSTVKIRLDYWPEMCS